MNDMIAAFFIHLLFPLAIFEVYLGLREDMHEAKVENPPHVPLLIILATYGGWLMMALTKLLWRWSDLAVVALFYLVLVAPIIMFMLAVQLYSERKTSLYHRGAFIASVGYIGLEVLSVVAIFMMIIRDGFMR